MIIPVEVKVAIGAAIIAGSFGAGWLSNGWRLDAKTQKVQVVAATKTIGAIAVRVAENKADDKKSAEINKKIEGVKSEEIAAVTARVNAAPRLRPGSAVCPGPVARAPEAESVGSSNGGDSSSGMVREDVDRDLKALIIRTERAFATGRACQAFAEKNGFVP